MILSTGFSIMMCNTQSTFVLSPVHRFQANAVSCPSSVRSSFAVISCKFGDHEIVKSREVAMESFCELFPQLDVVERTCLPEKEITIVVANISAMNMTFTLSFAGWDG